MPSLIGIGAGSLALPCSRGFSTNPLTSRPSSEVHICRPTLRPGKAAIYLFASRRGNTSANPRSVRLELSVVLFGEGSATPYAAIQVHCWISPLVAVVWGAALAVEQAALAHPDAGLGLLTRPQSPAQRRNHCSKRWSLGTHLLDLQSLLQDCRNRCRPSEIQHHYS